MKIHRAFINIYYKTVTPHNKVFAKGTHVKKLLNNFHYLPKKME